MRTAQEHMKNFYNHYNEGVLDFMLGLEDEGYTKEQSIELIKIDVEILKAMIAAERNDLEKEKIQALDQLHQNIEGIESAILYLANNK